jgi:hypothetical protein
MVFEQFHIVTVPLVPVYENHHVHTGVVLLRPLTTLTLCGQVLGGIKTGRSEHK